GKVSDLSPDVRLAGDLEVCVSGGIHPSTLGAYKRESQDFLQIFAHIISL
ncbi:MAG: hypothetical protein RL540_410, partial [Actinomycetota bacterium]